MTDGTRAGRPAGRADSMRQRRRRTGCGCWQGEGGTTDTSSSSSSSAAAASRFRCSDAAETYYGTATRVNNDLWRCLRRMRSTVAASVGDGCAVKSSTVSYRLLLLREASTDGSNTSTTCSYFRPTRPAVEQRLFRRRPRWHTGAAEGGVRKGSRRCDAEQAERETDIERGNGSRHGSVGTTRGDDGEKEEAISIGQR